MPLKGTVLASYSVPGNGKGKAPAIDFGQHDDDSSSVDRSREQSALFATPGPQATQPLQPRKRMYEVIADLREAQPAKRARTAANTPGQSVGPPRPTVENVEDEVEKPTDRPDHHGHHTVNRQPGDQTQATSSAGGKKTEADPSLVVQDPPQGSRNAQPVQPGPRATSTAGSTIIPVDLTEGDDENSGAPLGHHKLPRTGITAPLSELGEAVRAECHEKCEVAALTLSRRTDEEGKHIFYRCVGTAALLRGANTLAIVRGIMADDVKDVLVDANTTLSKRRDKYSKYFEGEDDGLQKLELKKMLDRQDARVERVEQARNWRKDLVNDLRTLSPIFLRRPIPNDR